MDFVTESEERTEEMNGGCSCGSYYDPIAPGSLFAGLLNEECTAD